MERCWSLDEVVRDDRSIVTVGTFDGVHVGHLSIFKFLVEQAERRDCKPVVVTFDPHPRRVVHEDPVPLLTTPGERAEVCAASGIQRFIVLPFDRDLASMGPSDFVTRILVERIGLRAIVVGYDHAFGRGRTGNHDLLTELGARHGFDVDVIPPAAVGDQVVSSSALRRLLAEAGDVKHAAHLLGRRYTLGGSVVSGAQRGRQLGFPTANVVPTDDRKLIPSIGVYAIRIQVDGEAQAFGGMMNIGRRPTFEETVVHLEAHLFDFYGDLYGRQVRVEFVDRMRSERKFHTVDALIAQLREDEARCRAVLRAVS